jgi:hypothetical protein
MYVCIYVMCVCVCVCGVYTYIHIYLYVYIYIHTYIHTYTLHMLARGTRVLVHLSSQSLQERVDVTSLYPCCPFVWRLSSLMTRSNITTLSFKLLTASNECVWFPLPLGSTTQDDTL